MEESQNDDMTPPTTRTGLVRKFEQFVDSHGSAAIGYTFRWIDGGEFHLEFIYPDAAYLNRPVCECTEEDDDEDEQEEQSSEKSQELKEPQEQEESKPKKRKQQSNRTVKRWTKDEDAMLRAWFMNPKNHYANGYIKNEELKRLAVLLGRSFGSTKSRLYTLGLNKKDIRGKEERQDIPKNFGTQKSKK